MLKTTDEDGNVLPEFEKVLDIDIKAAAEAILGKTLDQNLLSVVFDYDGNLWFATGRFRIYPMVSMSYGKHHMQVSVQRKARKAMRLPAAVLHGAADAHLL